MKNSNVYTVTQVTKYIKLIFKDDVLLNKIFIEGEISNFKEHSSGNLFFSIKDQESLLNCIIYSQNTTAINFDVKNGLKVICSGYISLYEKTGQYQFYIENIEPKGKGDLYLEYEKTKQKLEKLGFFDKSNKKTLPQNPKNIIIITSDTGSVIHDIINISNRRNPYINLILIPTLVQGEKAKEEIVKSIELANEWGKADIIILARGGGSIEDLFVFNEEEVAKAILKSNLPIVSAIGHETDFTISDFVADLRASTPSAAAEICVPRLDDLKEEIYKYYCKINNVIFEKFQNKKNIIKYIYNKTNFDLLYQKINFSNNKVNNNIQIMEEKIKNKLSELNLILSNKIQNLENKSPTNILKKGYTLIYSTEGDLIKTKFQAKNQSTIKINFSDGSVNAKIIK